MKILHVVASIHASTGGPAVSVTRLASEQAKLLQNRRAESGDRKDEVVVACLDYPHLGPQVPAPGVRVVSVKGNVLAVRGRGWSPGFRRVMMEEARKADIVHNHGLWMWPNAYAREAAVAAGKPLVISPRGMLEAWSLNRSKLRKAVAWRLFERENLESAAMFHATAASEAESIRQAVLPLWRVAGGGEERAETGERRPKSGDEENAEKEPGTGNGREEVQECIKLETPAGVPIVVAPNGVDLPDLENRPGREVIEQRFPQLREKRWIVFLSRIHPKKGLDLLLRAWARKLTAYGFRHEAGSGWRVAGGETETLVAEAPSSRDAVLVIAGPDLIGYRREVERMVLETGLAESVVLAGEVRGAEKDALLANADVFVLPSHSENFGIVVAEAMAWGRPVITTTGTPWQEVAEVGAGWWVKPEEGEVARALGKALGKGREELNAMGARGRALVAERYGWRVPAERLLKAYEEALDMRQTA